MDRLPLLSLLLMGPPFGRGGADATGDRRGARGRASAAGVSVVAVAAVVAERLATGDWRRATGRQRERDRELETEGKPMKLVGWNADRTGQTCHTGSRRELPPPQKSSQTVATVVTVVNQR